MKKEDIEIFIDGIENPAEPNQALKDAAERLKGKELFKESNDRARKILSEIKSLPIQETLEEVAERILANNIDGLRDALKDDDLFFFYKGVILCYGEAMAKWQQERSYSEEEVIAFGEFIFKHSLLTHTRGVKSLFEQFKQEKNVINR